MNLFGTLFLFVASAMPIQLMANTADGPREIKCFRTSDDNKSDPKLTFQAKKQRNKKYTVSWTHGGRFYNAKDLDCSFPNKKVPYLANCKGPTWEEERGGWSTTTPMATTLVTIEEETCSYNGGPKMRTVRANVGRRSADNKAGVGDYLNYYNQGDDEGIACTYRGGSRAAYFGYCQVTQ